MSFNPQRTKVQLRLALNRLKLLQTRKLAVNANLRQEIASLLQAHKEASATIRVENVIREDNAVEALEVLELFCELLLARFGLLESSKPAQLDPRLSEAISSLIWAAPRCEARELLILRDLLAPKLGREGAIAAYENTDGVVHPRVVLKLSTEPPSSDLVQAYLQEIASAYQVNWSADTDRKEKEKHQVSASRKRERERCVFPH
ncbi:MAG: regulator of Vps4 activity in the MVB pathway-domain-containing protein [Piptocephalis tieghemiana]|nr:MAG: regulator of Vps4 activity in the MVB pathway-domain-containing protein [Piptocephalis tieghemiana]